MTFTPRPGKTWEVLQVGKERFYWLAYYFLTWYRLRSTHCENEELNTWLIAEGFTSTREQAWNAGRAAAELAPGEELWNVRLRSSEASTGIRSIYRQRHARTRKPKPSTITESRREGEFGYLWSREKRYSWWPNRAREDGWIRHPITKITPKRIFIANGPANRWSEDDQRVQRSFDRAKLEAKGFAWNGQEHFFTDLGRARHEGKYPYKGAAGNSFPLLQLIIPFSRRDVMRRFRQLSHELHPDHGGDAAQFRQLVAEKHEALRQCSQ